MGVEGRQGELQVMIVYFWVEGVYSRGVFTRVRRNARQELHTSND
jgi:hypothetical protein